MANLLSRTMALRKHILRLWGTFLALWLRDYAMRLCSFCYLASIVDLSWRYVGYESICTASAVAARCLPQIAWARRSSQICSCFCCLWFKSSEPWIGLVRLAWASLYELSGNCWNLRSWGHCVKICFTLGRWGLSVARSLLLLTITTSSLRLGRPSWLDLHPITGC